VLYYLENLKLIADKIIFVSDNNLPEIEQNKLQNLCHKIIAKNHGEYDFGSYKRGLEEAYQYSQDYDAIIIANDSCYGPIKPLSNIFKTMEYSDCDFWGLTVNQEQYLPHLQSYFLVFNKKIINSEIFKNFFRKVKHENCKQNIIENYEIALTPTFVDAGFKMDSFIKKIFERNPTLEFDLFTFLMKNDFPFVKVSFINKKTSNKRAVFKDCLKNQTLIVLVKNHLKRIEKNRFFGIKLPNKFSKKYQ